MIFKITIWLFKNFINFFILGNWFCRNPSRNARRKRICWFQHFWWSGRSLLNVQLQIQSPVVRPPLETDRVQYPATHGRNKKMYRRTDRTETFLPTRVPVESKNVKLLPIKDVNRQTILKNYLRHIKNRNSADVAELERKYSMKGSLPSSSSPMERSKKLSFSLPSRHVNRHSCQSIYFDALDLSEGEDQCDSSDESLSFHSPLTGPSPTDAHSTF